jgi:hypothetical protein
MYILYCYQCIFVANPAGTPWYRNGTESFFGLKGRPSVVRDVKIHNQPILRMRRKQNRGPVLSSYIQDENI